MQTECAEPVHSALTSRGKSRIWWSTALNAADRSRSIGAEDRVCSCIVEWLTANRAVSVWVVSLGQLSSLVYIFLQQNTRWTLCQTLICQQERAPVLLTSQSLPFSWFIHFDLFFRISVLEVSFEEGFCSTSGQFPGKPKKQKEKIEVYEKPFGLYIFMDFIIFV